MPTQAMRVLIASILRLAAVLLAGWTVLSVAEWSVAWVAGPRVTPWLIMAALPVFAVVAGVAMLWRMGTLAAQPRPFSWPSLVNWLFRGMDQIDAIVLVAAGIITAMVGLAQLKTHLLDLHAGTGGRIYALGFDALIVGFGMIIALRPTLARGLLQRLKQL
jgi:hypothetical protein